MKRDSFIFYRSFFDCMSELNKEQKAELFDAICNYSLNFKEPELNGIVKSMFTLIRPNLEANNRKWINGKKNKPKNWGLPQGTI